MHDNAHPFAPIDSDLSRLWILSAKCQRHAAAIYGGFGGLNGGSNAGAANTSITTMAGLTPLLFESSFDAQFLRPMAVVMVFGLAFGTILILLLVPGLLLSIENNRLRLSRLFSRKAVA